MMQNIQVRDDLKQLPKKRGANSLRYTSNENTLQRILHEFVTHLLKKGYSEIQFKTNIQYVLENYNRDSSLENKEN